MDMNISRIIVVLRVFDGSWKDGTCPKTFTADKKFLCEHGMITEKDDPENEGYYLLEVTKRGKHMVEQILSIADDHEDCVLDEEEEEEEEAVDTPSVSTLEHDIQLQKNRAERWKGLACAAKKILERFIRVVGNSAIDPSGELIQKGKAVREQIDDELEEEEG